VWDGLLGLASGPVPFLALDVQVPTDGNPGSIGAVRVKGKGSKQRSVTVNWKACQAIADYLTERPATDCPSLFLSRSGSALSGRAIQR
jgi:site-specific recombinase XerC